MSSLGSIPKSFIVPSRLVFLMWLVYYLQHIEGFGLFLKGILPRTAIGLVGIIFAPLLHGSLSHLASNTLPVLLLGVTLYYFYGRIGNRVFVLSYFLTGFLVWLFGRPFYHLGASGLVYGMAAFLFVSGLVRSEFISLLIALVVMLAYGGLIWGISPLLTQISWESHLFGAIVGGVAAFTYRQVPIR